MAESAIGEILDRYDERLDELARRERDEVSRRHEFRERSERLIGGVIEPTLHEIGRTILERGHAWTVEERIDIQGQPAVACLFRPRETQPGPGRASELTFRCLFPERVSVTAAVRNGEALHELPARSHPTDEVDPQLVRDEVARFMSLVLERA